MFKALFGEIPMTNIPSHKKNFYGVCSIENSHVSCKSRNLENREYWSKIDSSRKAAEKNDKLEKTKNLRAQALESIDIAKQKNPNCSIQEKKGDELKKVIDQIKELTSVDTKKG